MSLTLIWAQATNGIIGNNGTIPWHSPEDHAFFRRATSGATVIMGRKTWDSLPANVRPLPRRNNIVVTRNLQWQAAGATRAGGLDEALRAASRFAGPVFVIGGSQLYAESLPLATRAIITKVDIEVDGDSYALQLNDDWMLQERERLVSIAGNPRCFVERWVNTRL